MRHRRVFDREVAAAYWRWEFLRRNPQYIKDVKGWITRIAKSVDMTEARFREWCRASGGDVGYGIGPEAMVNYQRTCERWGLQMLLLPETRIPEDEIAGFVFTDTPSKRFVERNPKLLREWARRQPNLEDGRPPGGRGNFSRRSTKRTLRESRPG